MTDNADGLDEDEAPFIRDGEWRVVHEKLNLTRRQMQIVKLLFAGRRSREVASALRLQPSNVDKHLRRLYVRTLTRDRTDLMLRIFRIVLAEVRRSNACGEEC